MGAQDTFIGMQPRGLSAEDAMTYLGLKRRAFDAIKKFLPSFPSGTSRVYDRHDLDALFERLKAGEQPSGDVGVVNPASPNQQLNNRTRQEKPWAARRASTAMKKPDATGSTSAIGNTDYATISAAIKKRKSG